MCRPSAGQGSERRQARPLSADVGGLRLAIANGQQGQGWVGHAVSQAIQPLVAEHLSDLIVGTRNIIGQNSHYEPVDLPLDIRLLLVQKLDSWSFEPNALSEEEAIGSTILIFESLFRMKGMENAVGFSLHQLIPLIYHLRKIYRLENPYHNFYHALDVLQAAHIFLMSGRMVPPVQLLLTNDASWTTSEEFDTGSLMASLGLREIFIIHIAAIGHDVGHPGFTNLFMKNADAPLNAVFEGKSALEKMHYTLLLHLMRNHGLGSLFDGSQGAHLRRLLWDTVMATDMSVHGAFMDRFRRIVKDGEVGTLCDRQVLISQAIIKCADISNPSRPHHISKHWAKALMGEWSAQSSLEIHLKLPITVQQKSDPLSEAKSQVFFIETFAKPLMKVMIDCVPDMQPFYEECQSNLDIWKAKITKLEASQTSMSDNETPSYRDDYHNVFSMTLQPAYHVSLRNCPELPSDTTSSTSSLYPPLHPSDPYEESPTYIWPVSGHTSCITSSPNLSTYTFPTPSSPWSGNASLPDDPSSTDSDSYTLSSYVTASSSPSSPISNNDSMSSLLFSPQEGDGSNSYLNSAVTTEPPIHIPWQQDRPESPLSQHAVIRAAALKAGFKRPNDCFLNHFNSRHRKRNSWSPGSVLNTRMTTSLPSDEDGASDENENGVRTPLSANGENVRQSDLDDTTVVVQYDDNENPLDRPSSPAIGDKMSLMTTIMLSPPKSNPPLSKLVLGNALRLVE